MSKKCIPFYQRCDGHRDCFSNEDEVNCPTWKCSQTDSFRCLSEEKCLANEDLCNNKTDCKDGEDENELVCGHFCEWPSLNTCSSRK